MKAKVVILNTEYSGLMQDAESNEEGKIVIGEREWDVENVKPILLEVPPSGGFIRRKLTKQKITPFYFMKQSTALPLILEKKTETKNFNVVCKCGEIVATYPVIKKTIEPLDMKTYRTMLSPNMLKQTAEMRFLKILKSYSEPKKTGVDRKSMMRVVYMLLMGVGAIYILYAMGFLKF